MSRTRRLVAPLAILLAVATAAPVAAAGPADLRAADGDAYRDRLIVTWRGVAPGAVGIDGVRGQSETSRPWRTVVRAEKGESASVAAKLRRDPRVLAVVPDARLELTDWPADAPPDDPGYPDQGYLPQIGVPDAWTATTGDPTLVVAVIDSGVDLDHPDLDDVAITNPRNESWNNEDVTDVDGHGTFTMGLVVAEADNGFGIAGIAPDVTLMPIKLDVDLFGGISFADALDGVDWARTHDADIISMSFGGLLTPEQAALAQPTFSAAREAGILMLAASGNDGLQIRNYPASLQGVVSVGAVDPDDLVADFSNGGRTLDLVAPGVDILSTIPDGDIFPASGTSAATPMVAAVAALVWSVRPELAVEELEAVLRASALDLGDPGHDGLYGDGRVDAAAALDEPVPDPLPVLEPPAPLPPLELAFTAPTEAVYQTQRHYTATIEASNEVADAIAILVDWRINAGKCRTGDPIEAFIDIEFALEMELTDLRRGHCYRLIALAIDEDGNVAEALSKPIFVLDPIVPTITGRRPASGATGIDRDDNVRVRFSEPVLAPAGTVRLRNTETGLIVRTDLRYDPDTNTVILDPRLRMYPRTTYRVEVTGRVQDRKGNPVGEHAWEFTTGRQ